MAAIPRDPSVITARRLRVAVGAGALAVLLGVGAVDMVRRSAGLLADARRWAKLDPQEARRQAFGAEYTEAIDAIRRDLPFDAWYLLVPPKNYTETGWPVWVRHDLEPRRPILIEPRGRIRVADDGAVPQWVRWVVLPGDGDVPFVLPRDEAMARLEAKGRWW